MLEEEDDADEVEEAVTPKEMRKALEVLERGYRQDDFTTVQHFEVTVRQLREELREKFPLKQTKLDNFLKM